MSSMAGFNNRVLVLTLLLASAALGLLTRGFGLHLGTQQTSNRTPHRWVSAVAVLLAAVLSIAIWLRARTSVPLSEATYFLDRYSMHRMGYRLFRDISFDYGPLMFFPAVWLSTLLRLTAGDGAYLWWVLNWVAGTALLWWTVQQLPAPPRHRTGLFVFAMAMLLPLLAQSAVNYTPLRYILGSACAMSVYRLSRRSPGAALALAALCQAVVLAYSPEQGISFALATVLFFAVCVRGRAVVLPLALFAAATAATVAIAAHLGLLQTMLDFGGGGYNLPLLFNTGTVLLVTLLLLAGSVAIGAFFDKTVDRPELYLIAIALFATPAAFGRADAGHIFVNALPALLVVLLVLFRTPHVRWAGIALACTLAVPAFFLQLRGALYGIFGPHLAAHMRAMLHQPSTATDAQAAQRASIAALLQHQSEPQLFAPLGYLQPAAQRVPLPVYTGRFFGYGLVSERFPQAKIAELHSRNDTWLLLPKGFDFACAVPTSTWLHNVLRLSLNGWYTPAMKHTTQVPVTFCADIHQHFAPSPQPSPISGYELYQRRP